MTSDIDVARHDLAAACRVMAHRGLVEDILGHISLRVDDDRLLARCRGPNEAGLRFTDPQDVRIIEAASGRILDDPTGSYTPPSELPIHTSVLAARDDVACVVHAHPPKVVVASLADLAIEPLFGAYNIPATRMAAEGIPVHPRSVLVNDDELAQEMIASLGEAPVLILRGHGIVTTGGSIAEAVLRALHLDTLARITLAVHQVGATPSAIPTADLAQLPDLGTGFNQQTLWRHHLRALEADGFGMATHTGEEEISWT